MCVWNSRIWVTWETQSPMCAWVSVTTRPLQAVLHATTQQPCEIYTVALPSLRGLGSVCPSLPGEEVGDCHGARPAFGRSVVLSWGHVTAQGWETTAVRSGGKRAGELLLLPCGEAGGDLQLEAQGGAVRWMEAGQATHLQEGVKACGPRQRKRVQGGNREAKNRAPQSSGSQGSPFPCEVWGNAMHWSQSTSFQALLLVGGPHSPCCHLPFSPQTCLGGPFEG